MKDRQAEFLETMWRDSHTFQEYICERLGFQSHVAERAWGELDSWIHDLIYAYVFLREAKANAMQKGDGNE